MLASMNAETISTDAKLRVCNALLKTYSAKVQTQSLAPAVSRERDGLAPGSWSTDSLYFISTTYLGIERLPHRFSAKTPSCVSEAI